MMTLSRRLLLSLCLLLFAVSPSFAALSANTVWECRASGAGVSDNNGGGFAPLTVSTFSGTDLVVDATLNTKVTSATHNFVAADVGTRIQISNAVTTTWTPGFYTINSVSVNAATLNASPAPISSTGGTWNEVGADYSQQNSPQANGTDLACTTPSTTVTSASALFTSAMVGNIIQITAGANFTAGFYQIITFTSATSIVLDRTPCPTTTGSGGTWQLGGALLTLGKLAGAMVASNKAYATGAFTSTATTTFAQSVAAPAAATPVTRLIGYSATRGDAGMATLTLQTNTGLTGISATGIGFSLEQFDVECATLGTSTAISLTGTYSAADRCKAANFTTGGIVINGTGSYARSCEVTGGAGATGCIATGGAQSHIWGCYIHDNTTFGISGPSIGSIIGNLVVNNSGASSDGISFGNECVVLNNTCHNNGGSGLKWSSTSREYGPILNNILTSNGAYGLNNASTGMPASPIYDGNVYWNNTSGARNGIDSTTGIYSVNPYTNTRDVTLSASPYIGPTTGSTANFALNNVATGGKLVKKSGSPATWPGNTGTTSYPSMGAVQTNYTIRIEIIR